MSEPEGWIEVPPDALSAEALVAVVDEFISRDGTDYGLQEVSQQVQRERALAAIRSGHIAIVFDPQSESVQLLSKEDIAALGVAGKDKQSHS